MNETAGGDAPEAAFAAEIERTPAWSLFAAAGVIVVGALVAARVVEMPVILPFLVVSSLGRRFGTRAVEIRILATAFEIGGRTIAVQDLLDVWFDDDEVDTRVIVAFGNDEVDVVALRFADRQRARELERELAAKMDRPRTLVAGSPPRLVDLLASLRFVAIAGAFFATGSRIGLLILVFFVVGLHAFVRARQVILREQVLEVRGALATKVHPLSSVASVDAEEGTVRMTDGSTIDLSRGALRDATMATAPWLVRARSRLFDALRSRPASPSR